MEKVLVLRCQVCHQVIGKPYISFDRRTQRHSTEVWQGKPRIVEPNTELAETYAPLSEIYTNLYQATKESMHKLHELDY